MRKQEAQDRKHEIKTSSKDEMGASSVKWGKARHCGDRHRQARVPEGIKVESLYLIAYTFFEVSGEITERGYGGVGGGYVRKEATKPSFLELGKEMDSESVEALPGWTKRQSQMCGHLLRLVYSAPFGDILQPRSAPLEQMQRKWAGK